VNVAKLGSKAEKFFSGSKAGKLLERLQGISYLEKEMED
jgi:hypothetical protein